MAAINIMQKKESPVSASCPDDHKFIKEKQRTCKAPPTLIHKETQKTKAPQQQRPTPREKSTTSRAITFYNAEYCLKKK